MDVVFFHLKSNLKRQKQTLLEKAVTITYVHINDIFSLKMGGAYMAF